MKQIRFFFKGLRDRIATRLQTGLFGAGIPAASRDCSFCRISKPDVENRQSPIKETGNYGLVVKAAEA
jgi:hypothetical protein